MRNRSSRSTLAATRETVSGASATQRDRFEFWTGPLLQPPAAARRSRRIRTSGLHRGFKLNLDPAGKAPIERLVRLDRARERLVLGENRRRIDAAVPDQPEQFRDEPPMVAVPHVDGEVLLHRLADRKGAGGLGIDADDRQRAGLG